MDVETVIVGASAAGLATAACLKERGREAVLLEKAPHVGAPWRAHYERLHLHTHKGGSGLPLLPFPKAMPRYPSRDQVVEYLELYARTLTLSPRLSTAVERIERAPEGGWTTHSSAGALRSKNVVVATGLTRVPVMPAWPGHERYRGELLHTSQFVNGERWRGKRALVIGFGNSAGEIALDLMEHGVQTTLSVRGAVNVIPRELLGVPILAVGMLLRWLPVRLADLLGAPLIRVAVGDIAQVGLKRLPYGPMEQIERTRRLPLIDVGTLGALRDTRIALRPGLECFTAEGVRFIGGAEESFDVVVAGTGYAPRASDFISDAGVLLDEQGGPAVSGVAAAPGLYFCGFAPSTRGMLRQIGVEARGIASAIASSAPSA